MNLSFKEPELVQLNATGPPMAIAASHAEERAAYAAFASQSAKKDYRMRLAELYAVWRDYNKRFFDGQLKEPHLVLGRTAPAASATVKNDRLWRRNPDRLECGSGFRH